MPAPLIPRATIRIQFTGKFGFADATEAIPYFSALGISHLYASPFLMARPGSTHGYDITDHLRFNPEVGDQVSFDRMVEALHQHEMGLILDFVPNHMGVGGSDNPWWLDVLEWGQDSAYARFFDINWAPVDSALLGKVLLPFLGDHYGAVLDRGELELKFDAERGSFSLWYFSHRCPIALINYPEIMAPALQQLGSQHALAGLAVLIGKLGSERKSAREHAVLRRETAALKAELALLAGKDEEVKAAIEAAVATYGGSPEGRLRLHELLERQSYRLAFWRVASDEINYRRFFDVNELAGLRMEDPELFELSHHFILRLIGEGKLDGLRLDHIDGLFDPYEYCQRLQDRAGFLIMARDASAEPGAIAPLPLGRAEGGRPHAMYLLVEKILARHERLRPEWPVDGTTGYEFMNLVNGVFIDAAAEKRFTEIYHRFTGRTQRFEEMVVEAKRQIMRYNLASELNVLVSDLHRLARQSTLTRDHSIANVHAALTEIAAHFPVYRTYITAGAVSEDDRKYLDWAITQGRRAVQLGDLSIFDFLHQALSTDLKQSADRGYDPAEIVRVAMKFQQFTGPVMAKALEDTAFYRYHRLVSLNEVGGEPNRFGYSPAALHVLNQDRLKRHPYSMVATSTHDHKRGEDTRMRINVLTELPDEWAAAVKRWGQVNRGKRREIDDEFAPGRNVEYLLYQMLVGAWPAELADDDTDGLSRFADRMVEYTMKAVREAKQRSSWSIQNQPYEAAVENFLRVLLDPAQSRGFLQDLKSFVGRIAAPAAVGGLSQTLIKLTVPGVPDIYQGTEFWDFSLVDPDNRRPVDFKRHHELLASGHAALARLPDLLANWTDGRLKQHVVASALAWRRQRPGLFMDGDYLSLEALGAHRDRLVVFMRHNASSAAITVAPRLVTSLLAGEDGILPPAERWEDTTVELPSAYSGMAFRNQMSGAEIRTEGTSLRLAEILSDFPVALLTTDPSAQAQ